ncbi:MAG: hypothetical protein LBJ17_08910 [Dysgonamonadaceae bacterium]|jgi:hypothetical protein|nr:hypothetical protein [Dysgonamonadaceae bacterium]
MDKLYFCKKYNEYFMIMRLLNVIIISLLLISCNGWTLGDAPIVKVRNSVLYRYDLEKNVLSGLSSSDSTIAAEHFVRRWIIDALVYEIAKKNVRDIDDIELMVEKYRRSLLIYRYQEQLLNEKFKGDANDSAFYVKRNEFLKRTEDEIYERALKRGEIQFYKE